MKTYSITPKDIQHQWYIVDAKGQTLGRLATVIATKLIGKDKPSYSAHIDMGDAVVVVNAANIAVTGNKLLDKRYYRHSGYPGGIKEISLQDQLEKKPEEVIRQAVKGMLPKNKLQDGRLARLKVYAGEEHPHAPQQPQPLTITKEQ